MVTRTNPVVGKEECFKDAQWLKEHFAATNCDEKMIKKVWRGGNSDVTKDIDIDIFYAKIIKYNLAEREENW